MTQPGQPQPEQLASFDQTHAAWSASLDVVIDTFRCELADGQNREISMAGLSQWLSATMDSGALAEHLAVAVDRLLATGAVLEQAERYARDLQDGTAPGLDEQLEAARAEGRRQATEVVRAQAALPDLVHFARPSDFRKGVLTCLAALEASAGKSAEQAQDALVVDVRPDPRLHAHEYGGPQPGCTDCAARAAAEQDGDDAHMAAMEERHQHEAEQDGDDRG